MFLTDDDITHAARVLYDWSGSKSQWAFNAQGINLNMTDPSTREVFEKYAKMEMCIRDRA